MTSATRGQELLQEAVTPRMKAADLARTLGVTSQAVSAWVRGVAKPSPEQMAKLETLLGIPMRAWVESENGVDESGSHAPVAPDQTG